MSRSSAPSFGKPHGSRPHRPITHSLACRHGATPVSPCPKITSKRIGYHHGRHSQVIGGAATTWRRIAHCRCAERFPARRRAGGRRRRRGDTGAEPLHRAVPAPRSAHLRQPRLALRAARLVPRTGRSVAAPLRRRQRRRRIRAQSAPAARHSRHRQGARSGARGLQRFRIRPPPAPVIATRLPPPLCRWVGHRLLRFANRAGRAPARFRRRRAARRDTRGRGAARRRGHRVAAHASRRRSVHHRS